MPTWVGNTRLYSRPNYSSKRVTGSRKSAPVRCFCDEATGQNGHYPITAVHRNLDPELTFLWVKSNSGAKELIETTPEHPFYLAQNVDGSTRPAPQGHEELNRNWVGAEHLKIGDKLRLASGELGEVTALNTVQQAREMYNLTVSQAHTYYVGQSGWLVHNCGPSRPASTHRSAIGLSQQLRSQEASSIVATWFAKDGTITEQALAQGSRIMDASVLRNADVVSALKSEGGNLSDWGKYSLAAEGSNGARMELHYYYNPVTKQAYYGHDYKVKIIK